MTWALHVSVLGGQGALQPEQTPGVGAAQNQQLLVRKGAWELGDAERGRDGVENVLLCSCCKYPGTCVCTCVHVCARVGGVSPVNVGFAEDGFQAVVKLKEGHILGGKARHQGWPSALPLSTHSPQLPGLRVLSAAPQWEGHPGWI